MLDPKYFLETVSAKTQHDSSSRGNVLGVIDETFNPLKYPQEKPRVDIPGQGLSHKGFTCLSSYRPQPGDRVLLMPVGSDYVIVGAINTSNAPQLLPGTVVWEATYATKVIPNNSLQYPDWVNIQLDLTGSEDRRAQTTRFHPGIPGWYSIGASVGFTPNSTGVRGVWLAQNSTTNTFNRVQTPGSSTGLSGLSTAPKLLYFNGDTDYAFVGVIQNAGSTQTISLSDVDNPGRFYAVYQGAELPEESLPMTPFGFAPADPGDEEDPGATDPTPDPTIKRFTTTYYPTWSATWDDYGKGSGSTEAYQGRYNAGSGGYEYTKWGFDSSKIRSDLSGATVVSVHWQMRNLHSYNNSGITVMLGTHNNNSEPGGSSSRSGNPDIYRYSQNRNSTLNQKIPNSFANALKNNTAQGIMIGSWNAGSTAHYGYFARYGSHRPILRIVYDKAV